MLERVVDTIKSRTRSEWVAYFKGKISWLREYSQENGEKAAAAGFLLGIVVVLFYKVALIIACVTVVLCQLVLILSDELPRDK